MIRPAIESALLSDLERLDAKRWLGACLVDWAVVVATFAAATAIAHPIGWALAVLVLGSRQQALGALFHDAAHGLVTRNRTANDVIGNVLAAYPLGLTLGGYRRYHFAHHAHLGGDRDPENHHKAALVHWRLPASPPVVLAQFASDLVGGGLPHIVAAGQLTRPVRLGEGIGLAAFWAAVIGVAAALHVLWVPIVWIVSIVTVFWSGVRLRIWTEHLGARDTHRIDVPPLVALAVMPHRIGLHWEHHVFPRVPFYHLGRLRAALGARPRLVGLVELWRGFVGSAPLASGAVAATVCVPPGDAIAPVPAPAAPRSPVRFFLVHVAAPLLAGAAVYARLRPPVSFADRWLAAHGLVVDHPHVHLTGAARVLAGALPSFVWTYAFTAAVVLVWRGSTSRSVAAWLALTLACALGFEFGQGLGLVPGTFSLGDVFATIAGFAMAAQYAGR